MLVSSLELRIANITEATIRIVIIAQENRQNRFETGNFSEGLSRCVKGRIIQIRTANTPIIKAPTRQITDSKPKKS